MGKGSKPFLAVTSAGVERLPPLPPICCLEHMTPPSIGCLSNASPATTTRVWGGWMTTHMGSRRAPKPPEPGGVGGVEWTQQTPQNQCPVRSTSMVPMLAHPASGMAGGGRPTGRLDWKRGPQTRQSAAARASDNDKAQARGGIAASQCPPKRKLEAGSIFRLSRIRIIYLARHLDLHCVDGSTLLCSEGGGEGRGVCVAHWLHRQCTNSSGRLFWGRVSSRVRGNSTQHRIMSAGKNVLVHLGGSLRTQKIRRNASGAPVTPPALGWGRRWMGLNTAQSQIGPPLHGGLLRRLASKWPLASGRQRLWDTGGVWGGGQDAGS